jgi:hypothetical protein
MGCCLFLEAVDGIGPEADNEYGFKCLQGASCGILIPFFHCSNVEGDVPAFLLGIYHTRAHSTLTAFLCWFCMSSPSLPVHPH